MGSWQERINQQLREETAKAHGRETQRLAGQRQEAEKARQLVSEKEEKKRDRLKALEVLDRVNAVGMLEAINRDVWRGLGKPRISVGEAGSLLGLGRIISLEYDYEFEALVPDREQEVTTIEESVVNEGGYNSYVVGTYEMPSTVFTSLRTVRRTGTSSLAIIGDAFENTPKSPTEVKISVLDDIWKDNVIGNYLIPWWTHQGVLSDFKTTLYGEERFNDQGVKDFLEKALLEACVRRTKSHLLPFQLGEAAARDNANIQTQLAENRRLLPWFKRIV